jgi:hypothetical protein
VNHGFARATTAVGGAGAIPQCQRALLLKHQKAPGELDHGAADPGIAGSGEPVAAGGLALSKDSPVRNAGKSGAFHIPIAPIESTIIFCTGSGK